jgi:hypothetical protein
MAEMSGDDVVIYISDDDDGDGNVDAPLSLPLPLERDHSDKKKKKKLTLVQKIKEKMPGDEGKAFLDAISGNSSKKKAKMMKDKLQSLVKLEGDLNDALWMHALPHLVEDLFNTFSEVVVVVVVQGKEGVMMRRYLPGMTAATSENGRVELKDATLMDIMKKLKHVLVMLLVSKEARKRCQEEYMKQVKMFAEYDAHQCDLHVLEWTKLPVNNPMAKQVHFEKQPHKTIMPTRWLSMLVDWHTKFFKAKYKVGRDETDTAHYFYFGRKEVKNDNETIIEKYISRGVDVDPFFPDMITFYMVVLSDTCAKCNARCGSAPLWGTIKARFVRLHLFVFFFLHPLSDTHTHTWCMQGMQDMPDGDYGGDLDSRQEVRCALPVGQPKVHSWGLAHFPVPQGEGWLQGVSHQVD